MIKGIFLIVNSDPQVFYNEVTEKINELQSDGLDVEVQYSTDTVKEGNERNIIIRISHSALLLGRGGKEQDC
jgi:chitinase